MDMMITKKNGDARLLEEFGVTVSDFVVSSIPLLASYGTIEGRHGTVDYGATYGPRTITVPFSVEADELERFPQKRDELFAFLVDSESYYIRELRRANHHNYAFAKTHEVARDLPDTGNQLSTEKSYLVRLQNTFNLEQMLTSGEGELVYETTELPFGESGIVKKTFTGTQFRLLNEGDVNIHPFIQHLKITIRNVTGSNSYFELENTTTKKKFVVNERIDNIHKVVMDGSVVTRNSLQFLRNTNREFIELASGWNDFRIYGATSATVDVEFKRYYK
ncbi:phage tail domain-containing protein [Planomicrobium okeanokoites]|uniref:Phage tail domain-containing protein n=1 Tax=Planomicrobium okeanokoites TaxID=244 RepID=A0ABV7KTF7_PLAOK|nr:phage tail domain-containing protein [Planomicrobium okeanokoites]TAA71590.1 hypothetical protein D2910_04745 [Planomicrobium okeanokoites]